jgi:hypothetical protein
MLHRSAHKTVNALAADINRWGSIWNGNPRPFVWHKTADELLGTLSGYLRRNL